MIGLYLYASGAQRQTISVLSTLGLSESYSNIITKNKRRTKNTNINGQQPATDILELEVAPAAAVKTRLGSIYTGTLHQLSDALRTQTRGIAETGLYSVVYDNINMMFRSAEQVIGRHGGCHSKNFVTCPIS